MNLQTVKARARFIGVVMGDLPVWHVTHPDTAVGFLACRPHDVAVELLKEHVLPRMVEGGKS